MSEFTERSALLDPLMDRALEFQRHIATCASDDGEPMPTAATPLSVYPDYSRDLLLALAWNELREFIKYTVSCATFPLPLLSLIGIDPNDKDLPTSTDESPEAQESLRLFLSMYDAAYALLVSGEFLSTDLGVSGEEKAQIIESLRPLSEVPEFLHVPMFMAGMDKVHLLIYRITQMANDKIIPTIENGEVVPATKVEVAIVPFKEVPR